MANLQDIRRRIRSVSNTRQITRAMKLVAAARLRRAQERALAARPYERMLASVLKSLMARAEALDPKSGAPRHPLLAARKETKILLLVVSGDRGLAGAFNSNIEKAAIHFINEKTGLGIGLSENTSRSMAAARMHGSVQRIEVRALGRKGRDFFRRRFRISETDPHGSGVYLAVKAFGSKNDSGVSQANELSSEIIERYAKKEVDSVYLAFNEFKSVIAQRIVVEKLLPITEIGLANVQQSESFSEADKEHLLQAAKGSGASLRPPDVRNTDERSARFGASKVDYIYEQPPEKIFSSILPKYVIAQVRRALLESVAAEHAARMTAMDSATNNANEMTDSLTLAMDRARQAKITKEIIEIVSGAAGQ